MFKSTYKALVEWLQLRYLLIVLLMLNSSNRVQNSQAIKISKFVCSTANQSPTSSTNLQCITFLFSQNVLEIDICCQLINVIIFVVASVSKLLRPDLQPSPSE